MRVHSQPACALLWDLDGVIVDSAPAHYHSWRQVLAQKGVAFPYAEFERFFGMRNEEFLDAYVPGLSGEECARLIREKEALYRSSLVQPVPMPGVAGLVSRAAEADVKQAVVSSTPKGNIEAILHAFGLRPYFETVVGAEQVQRGKPDPEGWLLAARSLACPPAQCVVIEDAPAGIQAARAAGMRSVGLAPTPRRAAVLDQADLVLRSLEDPLLYAFLRLALD